MCFVKKKYGTYVYTFGEINCSLQRNNAFNNGDMIHLVWEDHVSDSWKLEICSRKYSTYVKTIIPQIIRDAKKNKIVSADEGKRFTADPKNAENVKKATALLDEKIKKRYEKKLFHP